MRILLVTLICTSPTRRYPGEVFLLVVYVCNFVMPLNSPGGSTVQWLARWQHCAIGTGRDFLCLVPLVVRNREKSFKTSEKFWQPVYSSSAPQTFIKWTSLFITNGRRNKRRKKQEQQTNKQWCDLTILTILTKVRNSMTMTTKEKRLANTDIEHLYSPRMVEEIKEEKNGTSNKQTVIWPNYLNYLNYSV